MIEKYYNEFGNVAVLYSPGWGAGWSTWNGDLPELIFDSDLAKAVLRNDKDEVIKIAEELCPGGYFGGVDSLKIAFIEPGTLFRIDEYDGAESVVIFNRNDYYEA
jgi:hypothetical protein